MKLYLAKPDLVYFDQFNEMMKEWCESGTQIVPWFLDRPVASIEEFAKFIRMLDDCEHGIVDKRFSATTSFFVIDENDRLVGATSLRHYLTYEGLNTWGHIGYGIRPSERRKGYATEALKMMLEEAKAKKIYKVLRAYMKATLLLVKLLKNVVVYLKTRLLLMVTRNQFADIGLIILKGNRASKLGGKILEEMQKTFF